ncbi:uncharacterized protein LOC104893957 [Beta vulgaris subsp. vulgaris]|uniref:uncharacterized protein LOC104893957 n=1 Tax=Beta vulgaris subsp. vulgaris TaxID=3555 RepID=UPI00054014F4|nr:uncharacterized protein LOC104893957 [Beta vulgaris subsp. vulgaris]
MVDITNEDVIVLDSHHPRPWLSDEQRQQMAELLLAQANGTELPYGAISKAAEKFNVSCKTASTIWNTMKNQIGEEQQINVKKKMAGIVGRKRFTLTEQMLTSIPLRDRTNLRDLANKLGVCASTVCRLVKKEGGQPMFNDFFNFIHIDEKWFYMHQKTQRLYLHPNEVNPHRTCQSKRHIIKVMFETALARPSYNMLGQCTFDGKIGIFPFVEEVAAQRSSNNRPAGTLETKAITNVTKNRMRDVLINHILLAIMSKWPPHRSKVIYIEQDNAKPHVTAPDPLWILASRQNEFVFHFVQQPPNSPELNMLDLGFFRALQTLQHKERPNTILKLLQAVNKSFEEMQPKT